MAALPTLLEITKKGGRYDIRDLDSLRPSFRATVIEAGAAWEKMNKPAKYMEFVQVREQAGESLKLSKQQWCKDDSSPHCLLCAGRVLTHIYFNVELHHVHHCYVVCREIWLAEEDTTSPLSCLRRTCL